MKGRNENEVTLKEAGNTEGSGSGWDLAEGFCLGKSELDFSISRMNE